MLTHGFRILAMLFIVLACSLAQAQEAHQHHHQLHEMASGPSQTAHVHGIAALLVVLEGDQLDIELHSPAANLLGFEHRVSSPEQQDKVESAKEILGNASSLFQLDSAQCRLTDHTADFSSVTRESTQHDDDHYHHDHYGNDHYDNSHHNEDHDADHHDQYHEAHGHSDIEAHYRYRCERSDRLDSLATNIITLFPGIQSLEVQWIMSGRQGAATLNSNQRHVIFR